MRSAARTAFVVASLFAATSRADSTEEAVHLSWNAPAGCPSGASVMGDVQRILGGTTSHRAAARADVAELGPQRWSVHLVTNVDGAAGERSLEADSCEALASATALILALTVDPSRARTDAPPPSPKPAIPAPLPPRESRPSESLHVLVAASGAGDLGTLPGADVGGEIALGVLLGPIRGELSGADWLTQDATATSGEGTHIHLLESALRGCFRGRFGERFELDPCAGAALVFASSNGFGEDQPFAQTSGWGALRGDVLSSWRFAGPFALRATLGLGVPLARPSFILLDPQGQTFLHRAYWITGRGSLGLEVRFP